MTSELAFWPTLRRRRNQVANSTTRDRGRPPKALKTNFKKIKKAVASLDVKDLTVLKLVKELFTDAIGNRQYILLKEFGSYDDEVTHKLNRIAKKVAVPIKYRTFGGRNPVSTIAFLEDPKSACDACNTQVRTALSLFKKFLIDHG